MNKFNSELYAALYCRPWNIDSGTLKSLHNAFQSNKNLSIEDFVNTRPESYIDDNGIMHITIQGVLGDHTNIGKILGNTDYETLINEFKIAEESASGIFLKVNSGGGQSQGNLEVAEVYANIDLPKVSFTKGLNCSAAYKISVGSDLLYSSKSSMIGSIGTILAYVDTSKAWEAAGLKPDYIVSDSLKGAGFPPSLSEEQRNHMQEIVNDLADSFKEHVNTYRSIAPEDMRGQGFMAPRALAKNLVDGLGTETEAYEALLKLVAS